MHPDLGLGSSFDGLPIAARAARWAADAHAGQTRDADGSPFVVHPLEVGLMLSGAGYRDEVVVAGVLHDVVEKSGVTVDEVAAEFGDAVAGMVAALSEDEGIADRRARKADLRERTEAAGDEALAVFAADKLVKARELRLAAVADHASGREVAFKHAHYVASLELLERRLPGHPFTEALRFELATQLLAPGLSWLASGESAGAPATST